jgi:hypothetical protein
LEAGWRNLRGQDFFTEKWALALRNKWNSSANRHRKSLSNAGRVRFILADRLVQRAMVLEFDTHGKMTVFPTDQQDEMPTFSGPLNHWETLVSGHASAVTLVTTGKLRYRGTFAFAMRSGPSFDHVAAIAREIEPV